MAMTYSILTGAFTTDGSIKRFMNNPRIDVDSVLDDAQSEVYARLRVREMRTEATLTTAQGDLYVALPSGFLDPISVKDRYQVDIRPDDMDALLGFRAKDADGNWIQAEPNRYAIWDERVQFDCAMNAALSFTMLYFKQPVALSGSNETNFLTTRYPHVLRAAIRKHAAIWLMEDAEEQRGEAQLARALETVGVQDDLSYRGYAPSERG